MEDTSPVTTIITNQCPLPLKKKKRHVIHILRVALFMLRKKSGTKSGTSSVGLWKTLLGSMRPLHLQTNQSPPPSPPPQLAVGHVEEVLTPPLSPNVDASSSSSSFDGGMSQYASALNLQELDRCDEEEDYDDEEVYYEGIGDEMIDAKAEAFIAQFYEQMTLQKLERTNRTNWSLR